MAQFVVRNLEDDVAKKLKQRAKRHARSMEDEVRHILRTAASSSIRRPNTILDDRGRTPSSTCSTDSATMRNAG
jgi:plasmid stability protein